MIDKDQHYKGELGSVFDDPAGKYDGDLALYQDCLKARNHETRAFLSKSVPTAGDSSTEYDTVETDAVMRAEPAAPEC